jgi:hypothetical protein
MGIYADFILVTGFPVDYEILLKLDTTISPKSFNHHVSILSGTGLKTWMSNPMEHHH